MLINMSLEEYINDLSSDSPAPGGGAAAALTGAQGVALTMMVANHTRGKKKYSEYEDLICEALDKGEKLKKSFLAGVDADKEAFGKVAAAYAMVHGTEEEKEARRQAIAEASVPAAMAPFQVMKDGIEGLELTLSLMGKSNKNLVSDLYVAAIHLEGAVTSAAYNVFANTGSFKDKKKGEMLDEEARQMLKKSSELKDSILGR